MSGHDRRIHTRVHVKTNVRVSGPFGAASGSLRDISKGGVAVYLAQNIGNLGDTVELFLPFPSGVEIAVMAEIVRSEETPRGHLLGLRFSLVQPAMQTRLLELMEILLKSKGSETRAHARVSKRLPIHYGKPAEFKAMLENISMGGLSMTVSTPLVLNEEVEVSIPDLSGKELLILNGRVVFQLPVEFKEGPKQYRVGLEFKELTAVAKGCLDELLRQVLGLEKSAT